MKRKLTIYIDSEALDYVTAVAELEQRNVSFMINRIILNNWRDVDLSGGTFTAEGKEASDDK